MPLSPREIDSNKLYTVNETSRILAVTEQTVRKHLREKKLSGKKIGRRWHIKGTEIQKFIGE
ncbi:MAG: helix-turn-helix domain-containing protein [Candidatus Edwardsbacteria bacterium]